MSHDEDTIMADELQVLKLGKGVAFVKSQLAAAQGERRDLGPEFALRQRLLGAGRGIGANIEAVPNSMIARRSTTVPAACPCSPWR